MVRKSKMMSMEQRFKILIEKIQQTLNISLLERAK